MGCNHDCASCSQSCGGEQDLHEPLNNQSTVITQVHGGKVAVPVEAAVEQMPAFFRRMGTPSPKAAMTIKPHSYRAFRYE